MMKRIIWTLWWQGEDAAPDLVKACIASMRAHADGAEVMVLDKQTCGRYVTLPRHILEKVDAGIISLTHLSDIIRIHLLRDHGGLWLDSTVFVTADIPREIFELPIWTVHFRNFRHPVPAGRWTGFLLGGAQGNELFAALAEMLDAYWATHDAMADYVLIDYFIRKCYETIPGVREQLDSLPFYEGDVWELMRNRAGSGDLNQLYGVFQKTSYKDAFPVFSAEGGYSMYAQLLRAYGFSPEAGNGLNGRAARDRRIGIALGKMKKLRSRAKTFGLEVAFRELLALSVGRLTGALGSRCQKKYCAAVDRYLEAQACYRIAESAGKAGGSVECPGSA